MKKTICCTIFFLSLFAFNLNAAMPPDLPGEELTEDRLNQVRQREQRVQSPQKEQQQDEKSWLSKIEETWDAPPMAEQQAADQRVIPFGKGAVFIPRFSDTYFEPDIEIIDSEGNYISSGETGRTYTLEPGNYFVLIGSGSHRQRIVRMVQIEEGRTFPLIPDWAGLMIEIVDENGLPFRGEYELARIDEFDPYGRGYGASPEMGENVRTWILRPGIYKIMGVGEGYTTLQNFVTVRLVPGEFTRFLLIQDSQSRRIKGGGTVHITPSTSITPNWRYGANIGGNAQFNADIDHEKEIDPSSNSLILSLLLDTWINFRRKPFEWNNRLRIEEGFNISGWDLPNMVSTPDKLNMSSMFIWRFLPWLGPYSRLELTTSLFPSKLKLSDENWFGFVDENYFFDSRAGFDSSKTFEVEPAFSPTIVDFGTGVNLDLTTTRFFESKMRVGAGSSYSVYQNRFRRVESGRVRFKPEDTGYMDMVENSVILFPEERVSIFEFGPQGSISGMLRLGRFATAEAELKVFAPVAPVQRFTSPDLDFNSIISWRLTQSLTLDYTYRRFLKQPADLDIPERKSSHGIWLRLHYSSR
ncbi:hypothetical protein CHISP_1344 [Chitinispirillum alkaliphilum]|nr:hypothetical protein CHISP_1344 [Chitinispirillum alkaliphilum]